ncbi:hypothetical protein KEM48_002344 [Puccinia striiformis f. sp. tritici PST-130]|nr:hypothetical protein KEM48_002344 [Puccinia striiformis f. sp. tritici PST-130]
MMRRPGSASNVNEEHFLLDKEQTELPTSSERAILKLEEVQKAGFSITQKEQRLAGKIAKFSQVATTKHRAMPLSTDELNLLKQINHRTAPVRRAEQIPACRQGAQGISSMERDGKIWSKHDAELMRAWNSKAETTKFQDKNFVDGSAGNPLLEEKSQRKELDPSQEELLKKLKERPKSARISEEGRNQKLKELLGGTPELGLIQKENDFMKAQLWMSSFTQDLNSNGGLRDLGGYI